MHNKLNTSLKNYFGTLVNTGYLPENIIRRLVVMMYLTEVVYHHDLEWEATCEQRNLLQELVECIKISKCI